MSSKNFKITGDQKTGFSLYENGNSLLKHYKQKRDLYNFLSKKYTDHLTRDELIHIIKIALKENDGDFEISTKNNEISTKNNDKKTVKFEELKKKVDFMVLEAEKPEVVLVPKPIIKESGRGWESDEESDSGSDDDIDIDDEKDLKIILLEQQVNALKKKNKKMRKFY